MQDHVLNSSSRKKDNPIIQNHFSSVPLPLSPIHCYNAGHKASAEQQTTQHWPGGGEGALFIILVSERITPLQTACPAKLDFPARQGNKGPCKFSSN